MMIEQNEELTTSCQAAHAVAAPALLEAEGGEFTGHWAEERGFLLTRADAAPRGDEEEEEAEDLDEDLDDFDDDEEFDDDDFDDEDFDEDEDDFDDEEEFVDDEE